LIDDEDIYPAVTPDVHATEEPSEAMSRRPPATRRLDPRADLLWSPFPDD